ncbi:DNA polymerase III subunit gamma/tau [Patescibacteria group bacterium]|nr:DNA polymerase III subunit gamma/tau [Patescibacteria group bacterium]MBU1722023.1 DNA polymerase III subunit gamma/tau [Patescibacteria group bacterium]MBU1901227.1 DNA polymerase III subunit gamma/tau [Patescibacteria group bacterium]
MALYHTHRPQTFDDILGQKHIIQTITNQILQEKVAHAYLFFGPRGIGKTTTARLLAKAVNCTEKKKDTYEPCNTCAACTSITQGSAIDVIEIDAASHTGVDHVREHIIENAQFKPTTCAKKVFIIDEVHMLSTSAFNALLKTLEEPPAHVMFILATTELHKLPATIISRCQRFTYESISHDDLHGYLKNIAKKEGRTLDEDVIERIIIKSDGCVRDAVSLLEQVLSFGSEHITINDVLHILPPVFSEDTRELVFSILENNPTEALHKLHHMYAQNMHMIECIDTLIDVLRTLMITSVNPTAISNYGFDKEITKKIKSFHKQYKPNYYITLIESAMKRRGLIKQSPIETLPLELFIIEWTDTTKATTVISEEPVPTPPQEKAPKLIVETPAPAAPKKVEEEIPTPEEPAPVAEKKAPQETPAPLPETSSEPMAITKANILSIWNAFLERVEKESASLVYIVKTLEVVSIKDQLITFTVPFAFHKDKLTDTNCQASLTQALSDLLQTPVSFEIDVVKKEGDGTAPAKDIQQVADAFGGEVM